MTISRAWLITGQEELSRQDIEVRDPGEYEVLFETKAVSLCTVDRRVLHGQRKKPFPFLGGHECSGIVVKTGMGVTGFKPGDHVVFTSAYCGQCEMDHTGRQTQCTNKNVMPPRAEMEGTIMGGGLSEYLTIPAWQLLKVPEAIPFSHTCLTEPLACCIHSVQKANIQFGQTVVIIGFGIMGYFHLKLSLMRGARVIVSETDPERMEKARKAGAWAVIDARSQDPAAVINGLTENFGANVVFNTIPVASAWRSALDMLAPYGRLIAYSSQNSNEPVPVDFGKVHSKEIEIIGTLNPSMEDNDKALKLIRYGLIDMKQVIDSEFPAEKGDEAFKEACLPGKYRVVIHYESKETSSC